MALLEDDSGMEVTLNFCEFFFNSNTCSHYMQVYYTVYTHSSINKIVLFALCQLLVNSKIISLDLPVKDVYKKIWCPEGEVG